MLLLNVSPLPIFDRSVVCVCEAFFVSGSCNVSNVVVCLFAFVVIISEYDFWFIEMYFEY